MTPTASPLATLEQARIERHALQLIAAPEVRRARESARSLLLGDQAARTHDGVRGLDRALDQWVLALAMRVVNEDPDRPNIIWNVDNTPRRWFGHTYLGAAVAVDNPDNINRDMLLDGERGYVLTGQLADPPTQFTLVLEAQPDHHAGIGRHIAALMRQQLAFEADGSFTVTIDPRPADGRSNHLQTEPGRLWLFARDSLADWRQVPAALQLRRVSGPLPTPEPSDAALRVRMIESLPHFVDFWRGFKNTFLGFPAPNQLSAPQGRPGGWGYLVGGRFDLTGDAALVITTSDGGAYYTGFQITDPWTIAPDPIYRTSSLNKSQTVPNPDGTCTYVVSKADPGVHNWIDTVGLNEGWLLLRWQGVPASTAAEQLIRKVALVRVDELEKELPPDVPRATIETRRSQIQRRVTEHALRTLENRG
ncbi:MAG: hypothetical protein QOI59_2336 [Gammaproteobacteria bacterium]|jgi:hypothetical protein|nr:hypothetical protein [Gammaproteobacteria bacterium]